MILIFYNLEKNSEINPIFLKANASAHKMIHLLRHMNNVKITNSIFCKLKMTKHVNSSFCKLNKLIKQAKSACHPFLGNTFTEKLFYTVWGCKIRDWRLMNYLACKNIEWFSLKLFHSLQQKLKLFLIVKKRFVIFNQKGVALFCNI